MQLCTVHWLDCDEVELYTHFRLVDGGDPAPILAALQAHSGAAIIEWAIGTATEVMATPTDALLSSARETAGLRFCTALGTCTDLHLRAPNLAIFIGGATQVAAAPIMDLVTACLGVLTDSGGVVVTSFRGGWRGGPRAERG